MKPLDIIKSKLSLIEEIEKSGIKLIKKGNLFWGLCPFHEEKTASFTVNIEKNIFYCFGCGKNGDIVDYILAKEKISFKDFFSKYTKIFNLKLNYYEEKNQKIFDKLLEIYRKNLNMVSHYLEERKISIETAEEFKLGFANENESVLELFKEGFSSEDLRNSGIITTTIDRNFNRLIFPLYSKNNNILGFSGRCLDNKLPKYLNPAESKHFQKSYFFYNENKIKNLPTLIVEGYMDVIQIYQNFSDKYNVLGLLGTNLSLFHAITLEKLEKDIYFIFDGDRTGQEAFFKNIDNILYLLNYKKEIFFVYLPFLTSDPDSFIRTYGAKEFENLLKKATPIHIWLKDNMLKKKNKTIMSEVEFLNSVDNILNKIPSVRVKQVLKGFFLKNLPKTINTPVVLRKEQKIVLFLWYYTDSFEKIFENIINFNFKDEKLKRITRKIISNFLYFHKNYYEEYLSNRKEIVKNLENFDFFTKNKNFFLNNSYSKNIVCDYLLALITN